MVFPVLKEKKGMPSESAPSACTGNPESIKPGSPPTTRLIIPADERYLHLFLGYIHEICRIAGLSDTDLNHLEVASEEAFINIVEHAYPDMTPGDIFIEGTISPMGLFLSFRDEGIPFHQSPYEYPDAITSDGEIQSPHGLGFQIIRSMVDEVRLENLGKRGKVLHLVKKFPVPADVGLIKDSGEIAQAPPQQYTIRPMQPEEASQVCRLFWLVYGYTYKNEDFYLPEGLLELNRTGRVTSYVAVGQDNIVAGHIGLIRPEPVPMAEIGLLVVSPAHRGRRLMESLTTAIMEKAGQMGLSGISYNAVTSHDKSQKGAFMLQCVPCGLDLAACPPRLFKALVSDETPPQRESYLHSFKYLAAPPAQIVYLPASHQVFAASRYEKLGQQCTMGTPGSAPSSGDFRIQYDRTMQKGIITVITADERQWGEIQRVCEDMITLAGAEVVDLDLPLSQPATGLVFELAEKAGFVFTGIRPCQAPDGDYARLQRLAVPFDLDKIRIYPGFGEELVDEIAAGMAGKE